MRRNKPNPLILLGILTFSSSFSLLLVELAAARLVARHIGSSLETWTAVIGLLLTGVVLGNLAGGKLADRDGAGRACAPILFVSALACLAVLPLNAAAGRVAHLDLPWLAKVSLVVAVVLLPPSFSLGTLSPVVAGLALRTRDRIGGTMGSLAAWSSLGSILGTYGTGFILFSKWPLNHVILGVSLFLACMAFVAWLTVEGE